MNECTIHTTMLKIKVKHLTAEARIIRKEEHKRKGKHWGWQAHILSAHRRGSLREEARSSFVAYGLLRGLDYNEIEQKPKSSPDWKRVGTIIKKYGTREDEVKFCEMMDNMVVQNQLIAA